MYDRIGGKAQVLMSDLTANRVSDQDAAMLQKGYYEDLTGVNRFNSQLWDICSKRPSNWVSLRDTPAVRLTNDNLILELAPSTTIDFNGTRLSTNRWGMRDRDYAQIPPPDTYRIAMTGPSFVMGYGVADDEGFEWLLDERLNRENAGSSYTRYEILNFAVPSYSALQNLMVLEQKALPFRPNAIFFMAHQREEDAVVKYLADRLSVGAELPYPELIELARQAQVEPGMTKSEMERRLKPYGPEILSWTYRHIVEFSRDHGILSLWTQMNAHMNETLNIGGALLVKLFGRSREEEQRFRERAANVRDIGVRRAVVGSTFFVIFGLVSAVGTALVYGLGGYYAITGVFTVGTIVAFGAYLTQLYGSLQGLAGAPVEFSTSMVSFERVFEVIDLPQDIEEKENAVVLQDVPC